MKIDENENNFAVFSHDDYGGEPSQESIYMTLEKCIRFIDTSLSNKDYFILARIDYSKEK